MLFLILWGFLTVVMLLFFISQLLNNDFADTSLLTDINYNLNFSLWIVFVNNTESYRRCNSDSTATLRITFSFKKDIEYITDQVSHKTFTNKIVCKFNFHKWNYFLNMQQGYFNKSHCLVGNF